MCRIVQPAHVLLQPIDCCPESRLAQQPLFERCAFRTLQEPQHIFPDLFAFFAGHDRHSCKATTPRRTQDLTVPSGTFMVAAASPWLSPVT